MAPIQFPVTVHTDHGPVDLTVGVGSGVPFRRIRDDVIRAAGLPGGTTLFHGVGAVPDEWTVGVPPLVAGCALGTSPDTDVQEQPPLVVAVVAGPDAGGWVPLTTKAIRAGRSRRADLALADGSVSVDHALLQPGASGVMVTDLDSTNGVFVDGEAVDGAALATTGSTIRLGNTVLRIELATADPSGFTVDGDGYLSRPQRAARPREQLAPIPPKPSRPEKNGRRALPLASLVVGVAVGGGLALLLDQMMFLAFAAFGPLTMMATATSDRLRGRRSYRRQRADYRTALGQWDSEMTAIVAADRRACWRTWPGPAELLRRARAGAGNLWDRPPVDPAHLVVAVGTGSRPTRARPPSPLASPHPEPEAGPQVTTGPADGDADGPSDRHLADVPLTTRLSGTINLSGGVGRGVARWILMQLVTLHSPADVAIVLIGADGDLGPCCDVPHVVAAVPSDDTARGARWGDDDEILGLLTEAGRSGRRSIVVVLAGARARACALGSALLRAVSDPEKPWQPRCVLCLDETGHAPRSGDMLPAGVSPSTPELPAFTTVSPATLAATCRALAPLREAAGRDDPAACPDAVDLVSMTGSITARSLESNWQRATCAALIGRGSHGPVWFDLDRDGPHLLVAGTTGSGKSELLQTLVAGLAIAASPQDLTFLLIDYKGGAAFDALAELPHVVGVLTDLSPALSTRALASLRAELRAREARQAAGEAPGPKLVVVIDEFATLAVELPGFLAGILDIAQRGRSLGVHLVLATQRPAGVVSPAMRANISSRICLRVTDPAESVDVISSNDAAGISARHPGRAVIAHDGARALFQTAQVSVAAAPDVRVWRRSSTPDQTDGAVTILESIITCAIELAADRPPPAKPWLPPLPTNLAPHSYPCAAALVDVPDEQRQETLSLPESSLLVTGPPGSGRSTALRRLARLAADDGAEILVVDGASALADMRDWPEVSSYLDLTEPRLVLRLATLLSARQPRDGRPRCLLIDHYDLVVAALERTDYLAGGAAISELSVRSGHSVRIITSGPPTLANSRASALFSSIIQLGAGVEESVRPGRGRLNGREIQLVDSPPVTNPPPGTGSARASGWADRVVVRPLPTQVTIAELPGSSSARIPIGLGGDAAQVLHIDLAGPGGGLIVSGPRRSGVSTALRTIAERAADVGIPVVRVVTGSPRGARRDAAIGGLDGEPGAVNGVMEVIDVGAETEPLRVRLAAHSGPLLLVLDQNGAGPDHPAAALLEHFLTVCGAGQHLLLGERLDVLRRAPRGHLRAAIAERRGLLLSPDATDGALLDAPLPKRADHIHAGRGYWVDHGAAVPVQIAAPHLGITPNLTTPVPLITSTES